MKKLLRVLAVIIGLIITINVVMFAFNICPPQGPWPMPPWCETDNTYPSVSDSNGLLSADGKRAEQELAPVPSQQKDTGFTTKPTSAKSLAVKVEIITPYSNEEVNFTVNGQTHRLTRTNEIYARGVINLSYGDTYTISMGEQQKQGVFSGGYSDYLKEGKRTGDYPWSELKLPKELLGVDDFLFDYLPMSGKGRPLINGFYTGAGGNAQVMSEGTFFTSARKALPEMVKAGAGWVNIVPMWFFFPHDDHSYAASSELRPIYREEFYALEKTGYNYPTFKDEELKSFIREAHAAGLKVYLVPHITPANWGPNTMSGKASLVVDDIDVFFENYKKMITHYAKIAEETGVALLGLGCENDSLTIMEQNVYPGVDLNQKWYEVIDVARQHYNGKLTYSAAAGDLNYTAPNHVQFWDALDYIGFEWYLPITDRKEVSIDELVKVAQKAIEDLAKPLHQKYGKPIIFTEVGFEAKPYAWTRSYEGSAQDRLFDRLAAAICYEYLFQAIEDYEFIEGMFIWSWQPAYASKGIFPRDMWWAIANDGNEVQHSIVQPQITKWFNYYSPRKP